MKNQRKIQHLYLRAGFGEKIELIQSQKDRDIRDIVSDIFKTSENYTGLPASQDIPYMKGKKQLSREERREMMKRSRETIREMNIKWIEKMAYEPQQLREKMTLFWHGHFACRSNAAHFVYGQNNTLRKYALGKFGDLLRAVSKDTAMLQFLNNQQNKKKSPNENFAREVMELFTLGRGNYTENDVKESARAFTGWAYDEDGEFVFREKTHDDGKKTVLGREGNFNGDDIINILLEEKKTAEFVTEKIYKFFVNEIPDAKRIKLLSEGFYKSGYDITKLMREIFISDWFYDEKNIGAKIKSPIELIAGLMRTFDIRFQNDAPIMTIQRALGQVLFDPPNVAGWPGGRSWIDSSSLLFRMKLPEVIFTSSSLEFTYREKPAEMDESEDTKRKTGGKNKNKQIIQKVKADVNLSGYIKNFYRYSKAELTDALVAYLLQTDVAKNKRKLIESYADTSTNENMIESTTLRILSLPEYQLC